MERFSIYQNVSNTFIDCGHRSDVGVYHLTTNPQRYLSYEDLKHNYLDSSGYYLMWKSELQPIPTEKGGDEVTVQSLKQQILKKMQEFLSGSPAANVNIVAYAESLERLNNIQ